MMSIWCNSFLSQSLQYLLTFSSPSLFFLLTIRDWAVHSQNPYPSHSPLSFTISFVRVLLTHFIVVTSLWQQPYCDSILQEITHWKVKLFALCHCESINIGGLALDFLFLTLTHYSLIHLNTLCGVQLYPVSWPLLPS